MHFYAKYSFYIKTDKNYPIKNIIFILGLKSYIHFNFKPRKYTQLAHYEQFGQRILAVKECQKMLKE